MHAQGQGPLERRAGWSWPLAGVRISARGGVAVQLVHGRFQCWYQHAVLMIIFLVHVRALWVVVSPWRLLVGIVDIIGIGSVETIIVS